MASVIRAARIDREPILLAMRGASPVRPAAADADDDASELVDDGRPDWLVPPAATQPAGPELLPDRPDVVQPFHVDLAQQRSEVLEQARSDGFAEGVRDGGAGYAERLATLAALITSAHGVLENEIAGAEDVIVEIAFEAVCKVLGETMVRRDGVVAIVREILRSMPERERLLLRVAPADFELLDQHRAQLLAGEDGRMIDLVADERIALGGCLVETTGGTLDGRLETQLQRLIDTLTSARRMQGEALT